VLRDQGVASFQHVILATTALVVVVEVLAGAAHLDAVDVGLVERAVTDADRVIQLDHIAQLLTDVSLLRLHAGLHEDIATRGGSVRVRRCDLELLRRGFFARHVQGGDLQRADVVRSQGNAEGQTRGRRAIDHAEAAVLRRAQNAEILLQRLQVRHRHVRGGSLDADIQSDRFAKLHVVAVQRGADLGGVGQYRQKHHEPEGHFQSLQHHG
jgi:hypothetical protein